MTRCDAIVVGGGLMGASTALHLRREHGMGVALLERGFIGAQASGVNFGNVRRQGRFLPQLPLAHRSRALWGRLGELVGEDCEFAVTGHLKIAYDAAEMAGLESYARDAADYGLALDIIGSNELRSRFPFIGPDAVGATYSPDDGNANPRLVGPAFGRAARAAGADVHEHCAVTDIQHDGTLFRVTSEAGAEWSAPVLVNAAGAWGGAIAAAFGEPVPLAAQGPQMAVTEPLPYFVPPVLGTASALIYVRQTRRGNVVFGGGPRGPVQLDPPRGRPVPGNHVRQWAHVVRLLPALRGAQVIRSWTGVEGFLADMLPVLGPSRTRPGLIHAFGFCGHGFQLGPGVGAVVAELAATGATSTPIAPFSVARFAGVAAEFRPTGE